MSETPLQDEEKHTFGIVAACEKRRESDMLRSSETLVNVLSVRSVKFWTAFTWIYLFRLFPCSSMENESTKNNFRWDGYDLYLFKGEKAIIGQRCHKDIIAF